MFENVSQRFSNLLGSIRHRKLTEANIRDAVKEVRNALLEADVSFSVVAEFVGQIQAKALGTTVSRQLQPGNAFVKIINDELVELMGKESKELDLGGGNRPNVVLMAGLQGVGKTTTVIKLAKRLVDVEKKQVSVVSADVHRPAAIEQLRVLAGAANIPFISSSQDEDPRKIARSALAQSRKNFDEVLIVDTAGRLTIDQEMMQELKELHGVLSPRETLFVVDSMTGQDAANTARAFDQSLALTGVILAKTDGDARGGAAMSVRVVTGKPIKFLGTGEGLDRLEPFRPDRIASRILGMGDVLSLVEEAERKLDKKKAVRLSKKILGRKRFNLQDMRDQLQQMKDMGGLSEMMKKFPEVGQMQSKMKVPDEEELDQHCVIIDSMTMHERKFPYIIVNSTSRKRRIANGSGTKVQDVSFTLRKFNQMDKQMKRATSQKTLKKLSNLDPNSLNMLGM